MNKRVRLLSPADFKPGLYRHYKGGVYRALLIVRDSESTDTYDVIYMNMEDGTFWSRPWVLLDVDAWTDEVQQLDEWVPRFKFIDKLEVKVQVPTCDICSGVLVIHAQSHLGKPAQLSHYCKDGCRKVRDAVTETERAYIDYMEDQRRAAMRRLGVTQGEQNMSIKEDQEKWLAGVVNLKEIARVSVEVRQNAVRALDIYANDPSLVNQESLRGIIAGTELEVWGSKLFDLTPPRVTPEE